MKPLKLKNPMMAGCAALLAFPSMGHSVENLGENLEIFGAARVSVDYMDSDVSQSEAEDAPLLSSGSVGISSNTSTFGFRGTIPIADGYEGLWQYDTQVDLDDVDEGDVWTTRDSYLGLRTPAGDFLLGRVNTPFKNMGVAYTGLFNTTIGDTHAILGASSAGPARLDLFGANSLTWRGSVGSVDLEAQYSADQSGSVNEVDDNDRDAYSARFDWSLGNFGFSGAYINFSDLFGFGSAEAYRGAARYSLGQFRIGAVFEDIDADNLQTLSRQAYGMQLFYSATARTTVGAQWHHAEESDAGNDSADQYSLGVFYRVNPQILIHGMYTTTRNDTDAAYRGVDYAHGDKLGTLSGRNPQAFSTGFQYNF